MPVLSSPAVDILDELHVISMSCKNIEEKHHVTELWPCPAQATTIPRLPSLFLSLSLSLSLSFLGLPLEIPADAGNAHETMEAMHEYMCNCVLVAHFNELQCDEKTEGEREMERKERVAGAVGSCVDSASCRTSLLFYLTKWFGFLYLSPARSAPHAAGMQ